MALTNTFNASNTPVWDNTNTINVSPTVIKGEPVVFSISSDDRWDKVRWLEKSEEEIKLELVKGLVETMYRSGKYIEFTREQLVSENRTMFRARVFVTPGDITQWLRIEGVIE